MRRVFIMQKGVVWLSVVAILAFASASNDLAAIIFGGKYEVQVVEVTLRLNGREFHAKRIK